MYSLSLGHKDAGGGFGFLTTKDRKILVKGLNIKELSDSLGYYVMLLNVMESSVSSI
jgi:hypothetical protein